MKWFLCAVLVALMEVSYSAKIVYRENDAPGGCVWKDVVQKVGCYRDGGGGGGSARPLTEELVNIRDPTNPAYVKDLHLIWNNWQGSLNGLVCECAKRAAAKGYKFIGLQFYGECWSGPKSENYAQDGEASTCIQQYSTPCDVDNEEHPCVGKEWTNYVYRVKSAIKSGHKSAIKSGHKSAIKSGHENAIESGHKSAIKSGSKSAIKSGSKSGSKSGTEQEWNEGVLHLEMS